MPSFTSILAATAMIGGGLSAFGQYKEGQEAKKVSEYNAQIAEQEAGVIRQNAELNLFRQRKELAGVTGGQIAGYAKRGVSPTTGTPLDVIADTISNAELEIQIGQWNSEQEARRKENEAKMGRYYGKESAKLATTKAFGTLLSTGAQAASRFGTIKTPTQTALEPNYLTGNSYQQKIYKTKIGA